MHRVAVVLAVAIAAAGCQNSRQKTFSQAQNQPDAGLAQQEPKKKSAFSLSNIWKVVSFQSDSDDTQPLVPKEVVEFGKVVRTIATRASDLNANDPPEVTRQKAMGLLESLKPWDSLMAAGQSMGVIRPQTANVLNTLMGELKTKTQELVDYVPKPETIRAVKYLAGQLGMAYSNTVGLLTRGGPAAQTAEAPTTRAPAQ